MGLAIPILLTILMSNSSLSQNWSYLNQLYSGIVNALTGLDNEVYNDGFSPNPLFWFGDILLILLLITSLIISINMLIAMMGAEFTELKDKNILKRKQFFSQGDIYLQAERFLLPPPLNIMHIIILGFTCCCCVFKRWQPKDYKPPYIHSILVKEMYFTFKSDDAPDIHDFFKERAKNAATT